MITSLDQTYAFMCRRNKALVKELSTPPPGAEDLYFATQFSQSTWGQFKSCLWKTWWTYWRSPDYNLVRFSFTLAAALMVGTIFWKVGTKRSSVSFKYYNLNFLIDFMGKITQTFIILLTNFFSMSKIFYGIGRLQVILLRYLEQCMQL